MLLIVIAFILFALMVLSLAYKQRTVLLCSYITYVVLYDWLFIQINLDNPSIISMLLQVSQELVILAILATSFCQSLYNKRLIINREDILFIVCIIVPMIISAMMSLLNGDGVGNIISGMRLYFIPIIIPYLFYRNNLLTNISIKSILYVLIFLALTSVVYGIIQVNTYSGNLSDLWFYKYGQVSFYENSLVKSSYNFIRDNDLRATGPFVSSIVLTTFLAYVTVLTAVNIKKIVAIPIILILIYGVNITLTRVGFLIILISLGIYLFDKFKYIKKHFWMYLAIPILIILLTFLSLTLGFVSDLSSLGRAVQYLKVPTLFTPIGYGVGNELAMIRFDSLYISLLMGLGIFVVFYLYYFFNLIYRLYKARSNSFVYSVMLLTVSCVYVFAFQFMAGSASFRVLFLLIFIALAINKDEENATNRTL